MCQYDTNASADIEFEMQMKQYRVIELNTCILVNIGQVGIEKNHELVSEFFKPNEYVYSLNISAITPLLHS